MLRRLLHRIVAHPRIYDLVQRLVGAKHVRRKIAHQVNLAIREMPHSGAGLIVDIGGGTGAGCEILPPGRGDHFAYLLLDNDPIKVHGFLAKNPDQLAVVADAGQIPLPAGSADMVLCLLVAHHLNDALFRRMLDEVARVLKPTGKFIFADPIYDARRAIGRLLWRYDRGSHRRTADRLRYGLSSSFNLIHDEIFAVLHGYYIGVGVIRIS